MDSTNRKTLAIVTSDIHITNKQPICRKDNYKETLIRKLEFVKQKQKELSVPVLDAGDSFDTAKPYPEVISMALKYLPEDFITIAGNHCTAYHNKDIFDQTALYAVSKANTGVTVLKDYETILDGDMSITGFPYGCTDMSKVDWDFVDQGKLKIALLHIMTYDGEKPYPQCTDLNAKELCTLLDSFDIVITGHNHQCFTKTVGKTTLLNPGSLMRSRADQKDYKPRLWYIMEDGSLEYEEIPIDNTVISDIHIVEEKEANERMESFVSNLKGTQDVTLSFVDNINKYLAINEIDVEVKDLINESLEESR